MGRFRIQFDPGVNTEEETISVIVIEIKIIIITKIMTLKIIIRIIQTKVIITTTITGIETGGGILMTESMEKI